LLQKAAEIREQAATVSDPAIRTQLLFLASQYEAVADHHERTMPDAIVVPPRKDKPPTN
jgi:hypothetical protein